MIAYLLGDLAEAESEQIAEHVEGCPACEAAADRLERLTDSVVAAVRRGGREGTAGGPGMLWGGSARIPERRSGGIREEAPPEVPGFEVLGLLGRGGMGAVFEARQLRLGRKVALKVVTIGEASAYDRFRAEAEAIAALRHPNIVQIFEVGESSGRPYVALELIEGGSLDRVLAGRPLPARRAAELSRSLALAVGHAHARGIIHRDLKPANILLAPPAEPGGPPVPKVTDFGIAKRMEEAGGPTREGDLLGTPASMAPEQATGDLDRIGPATDVYGLGVILYEMLTGQVPFRGTDAIETLLLIRTQEPVSPRRLNPKLPRDLETICLKCLEKEPARRYASAEALAEDLRRYLSSETITARPATGLERAGKWARRRPSAATALGVSAVALLALIAGGAYYNARLRSALQETREAKDEAVESLASSESSYQLARRAVDRFLIQISESVLFEEPGMLALRNELLGEARDFFQEFIEIREDDPRATRDLARALTSYGVIQWRFGELDEAITGLQRAVDLLVTLDDGRGLEPEERAELARALWHLGQVREFAGRRDAAISTIERAIVEGDAVLRAAPQAVETLIDLAEARTFLAGFERDSGRYEASQAFLDAAARRLQTIPEAFDSRRLEDAWLGIFNLEGQIAWYRGDFDASLEAHGKVLERSRTRLQQFPGSSHWRDRVAGALNNVASCEMKLGRLEHAAEMMEESLQLHRELAMYEPESVETATQLAASLGNLAAIRDRLGQPDKVEEVLREAVAIQQSLADAAPGNTMWAYHLAASHGNLGNALLGSGRHEDALEEFRRSVEVASDVLDRQPQNAMIRNVVRNGAWGEADCLVALGRPGEAVSAFDRAFEVADGYARKEIRAFRAAALARDGAFDRALAEAITVIQEAEGDKPLRLLAAEAIASLTSLKRTPRAGEMARLALQIVSDLNAEGLLSRADLMRGGLEPLRNHPAFRDLLLDVGFPADPFARRPGSDLEIAGSGRLDEPAP